MLLGDAPAHNAGGDASDAFGSHDRHHPMQKGFAHALITASGLDINCDELTLAALSGHHHFTDEDGVSVKPEGHEMRHAH